MEEPKSKTQKKREADALQKLGTEFINLKVQQLDLLNLPDALKEAILAARKLKSHGAQRRQAQLIGKLMRSYFTEEMLDSYQQISQKANTVANKNFFQLLRSCLK